MEEVRFRSKRLVFCVDCEDFRWVRIRGNNPPPERCQKCNCKKMNADRFPSDVQYASKDPLYGVWMHMRGRCYNPSNDSYARYGGRGITVCKEWDNPYVFIAWCRENGYDSGLQLNRKDNDGPYSPDNCKFSTNQENSQNTSRTVLSPEKVLQIKSLLAKGVTVRAIAKRFAVSTMSISGVKNGKTWSNVGHNFNPKRFNYLSMVSGC